MSAARPGIISSDEVSVEAGSGVLDADVLRTRRLLEPLREQVVQHWQDAQTIQGRAPHTLVAPEQLEVVFDGLLQGRVPEGLLGELTLQAAAHGVDPGIWAARVGSLIDTPLELIAEQPNDVADLRAAARVLASIRQAAISIAVGAYPQPAPGDGGRRAVSGRDEVPAHLLRRILGLSTSVGPDTSLEVFSHRLVQTVCEMGSFTYAVLFSFDAVDDAFYAEANYGLRADDWQEVLAVAVPRRVYDRVVDRRQPEEHIVDLRADDPLLADPEIAACFAPLQHYGVDAAPASTSRAAVRVRTLLLMPLEVPGRGTIGFCAAALPGDRHLRASTRRALHALASQGAVFIENIHLYRLQSEEAAVSSALLQVAGVVGATDVDVLLQRTLGVLPRLFGGQLAALLYLDRKRSEVRMLEPKAPDGQLTALTEVMVTSTKLEQLEPVIRGNEPVAIEEADISHLLPVGLVQARGLRSALIIPLTLSTRPADALVVFWTVAAHRFRARDLDVARGVSELVGVALANAQLFTDATNRAEQLSSLYRTGQMMSSSLDLDGLLRTITQAAVQLTRSKLCMIYLIDPRSGMLDFVAGAGLDFGEEAYSSLKPGEGLLGRCALLGKPLLVDDLQADRRSPPLEPAITADLRAALFLPLIASGEVIGVLATAAQTPGYFLAEHQQILQAFAHQAAVAIERARLYAAEQRRRELAELQQTMTQSLGSTLELRDVLVQVLRFARDLVGYDTAAVHIFNGAQIDLALVSDRAGVLTDAQYHSPYLFVEPLYAHLRESGSAIVVSDVAQEPLWRPPPVLQEAVSWIGVPLLIDADYIVLLDLFSLKPSAYTQEDADTMAQFAHQVAFAVRNARIYAREREAKMRLEELDQLRADFVSTVSHELRTPLTGIKGFTETLLTYWTRLDDDRKHHYLDRIYSASKRLQRLVQDLLFVSKVEGGNLPLSVRRVQPVDLLDPAVMEIAQKYRGQVVHLEVPESLPLVLADGDRAQQVLVNLMDNGVKYSPEGSPITVRCTVLPEAVELAVIDHGPGIRSQDLPRLFTRFGKIDQVIRAGHVGTGLGLFISKQLVEQMNGTISVNSVLGQGSTFSFTLPRADL